ncbi:ABC transporter permease [Streptomyces sp. MST-110588]|uniref:ABC transporter permease n=1 Tax=Streptomyces sp. MST-110588 TaxID=2833628 RepID=UPI001F5DACEA|nr:ABC transporter permease [Streptomyces sp. MST-110588]UNO42411.1 ABC transporter permease [Streptomyces sp. MST-110588]
MSTATVTAPGAGPRPVEAGADEGRIGLRGNLRHIGALVRRNALQIKADPESMFDALLMPVIFTLLFVYVFGGAVGGSIGGGSGHGRDVYINYIVPGLMAMGGLNIAMSVGSGVNDDFNKGVMDRFRTMPIARSSVLIAKLTVEAGRMLVSTVVLLVLAFIIGFDLRTGPLELLAAVGLALLFGTSLTWIFMLIGLSVKTPQAVQGMGMLIMMPLQFGSSVFAPPTSMPGWLEAFTKYNPLSNLADAARALLNGQGAVAHPVLMTLGWTVALTAVAAPLAVSKFRKKT